MCNKKRIMTHLPTSILTGMSHTLLGFSKFIICFKLLKHTLTSVEYSFDSVRQSSSFTTIIHK